MIFGIGLTLRSNKWDYLSREREKAGYFLIDPSAIIHEMNLPTLIVFLFPCFFFPPFIAKAMLLHQPPVHKYTGRFLYRPPFLCTLRGLLTYPRTLRCLLDRTSSTKYKKQLESFSLHEPSVQSSSLYTFLFWPITRTPSSSTVRARFIHLVFVSSKHTFLRPNRVS